ncbi:hypothetical protein [Streptomyces chilikensis]|uniref:Uncharacterized protein n=1 Tax=Streptomyces chilikensis TaxID=1194079 RepID=A0ABV3EXQ2_9ACTN
MTDRIKDRLTDHTTDHGTDRADGRTDHGGHTGHHAAHAADAPVGHSGDGTGTGGWGPGGSPDAAVTPVRPLSEPGVPPGSDNHDLRNEHDRSAGQGIHNGQVFQDTHDSPDGSGTLGGRATTGTHGSHGTGAYGAQGTGVQGTGVQDDATTHGAPHDGTTGTHGAGTHGTGTHGTGNVIGGAFGGVTGTGDGHGTHGTHGQGADTHGTGTQGSARHTDDGPGETLRRLLPHEDTEKLTQRVHHAMGSFVDEPRGSVAEAEKILDEVSERLSSCLTARRRTLRTAWQSLGDETADPSADTEQLRLILRDYRELTERLLRL